MWKNSQRTLGCSALFFQNGKKSFDPFRQVKRIICHRQNLANINSQYRFSTHGDNRLNNADLHRNIQIRIKSSVACEKNHKILAALQNVDEKDNKSALSSAKQEDRGNVLKDDNEVINSKDGELLPIFKHLPKNFMHIGRKVDPYIKLMRIDKPIGEFKFLYLTVFLKTSNNPLVHRWR